MYENRSAAAEAMNNRLKNVLDDGDDWLRELSDLQKQLVRSSEVGNSVSTFKRYFRAMLHSYATKLQVAISVLHFLVVIWVESLLCE